MTCWSTAAARSGVVDVIQVEYPVGLGSTAAVGLLVGVVDGMAIDIAVVAPMSNGSPLGRIKSADSRRHCDEDSWEFLATELRSLRFSHVTVVFTGHIGSCCRVTLNSRQSM